MCPKKEILIKNATLCRQVLQGKCLKGYNTWGMEKFIKLCGSIRHWVARNKILLAVVVVIALFTGISICCEPSSSFIGGWVASFIISWLFYNFSVKKEIAEAVEKTKKDVEENLNEQFNQYREFLNKVHDKSTESLLRMYKTHLVNQLENDMAKVWDVRPGATVGADASLLDPTAMDNADDKYYKMYQSIHKHSEDLFNSILNGKFD